VSYVGAADLTKLETAKPPNSAINPKCVAVAVLPWFEQIKRPFYLASSPRKMKASAHDKQLRPALIGAAAWTALFFAWLIASDGFLDNEDDRKEVGLLSLLLLVPLNTAIWGLWLWWPSHQIDALVSFVEFYDKLPAVSGQLLPLAWSQADKLFTGPPHPPATKGDTAAFYWVLGISCGVWLLAHLRRIYIGLHYRFMSNPIADLRAWSELQGRTPTPEEYTDVLMEAGSTMTTWQLQLLKRKMEKELQHEC